MTTRLLSSLQRPIGGRVTGPVILVSQSNILGAGAVGALLVRGSDAAGADASLVLGVDASDNVPYLSDVPALSTGLKVMTSNRTRLTIGGGEDGGVIVAGRLVVGCNVIASNVVATLGSDPNLTSLALSVAGSGALAHNTPTISALTAGAAGAAPIAFRVATSSGAGAEIMRMNSNLRVGIGTANPAVPLHVTGSNGVGVSILASHDIVAASDARLKHDVRRIERALDRLGEVGGYTFAREPALVNAHATRHAGLLAHEVQAALPEVVQTDETTGYLSVAYGNFSALLVEAVNELRGVVDDVVARLDALERRHPSSTPP